MNAFSYFDAHAHLQDDRIKAQSAALIAKGVDSGLRGLSCCGTSETDWDDIARLAETYPLLYPSFGLHPWYVEGRSDGWLQKLEALLVRFPEAGVGEIGLDGTFKKETLPLQEIVLSSQLELALHLNRAVSLHCLNGWEVMIAIIKRYPKGALRFMVHRFSGSADLVHRLLALGGYFSFSASLTDTKRKKVREALLAVPAERLLFESDAPDRFSEPSTVLTTIKAAAQILSKPPEILAEMSLKNSLAFFGGVHAASV